jgi:hypothetical protein
VRGRRVGFAELTTSVALNPRGAGSTVIRPHSATGALLADAPVARFAIGRRSTGVAVALGQRTSRESDRASNAPRTRTTLSDVYGCRGCQGEECEFAEVGSDDGEVSPVERGDLGGAESLGNGDHGCVHGAEGQVAVSADELGDAHPVSRSDRLGDEVAGRQVAQESDLGVAADAAGNETYDFGDHEGRDDQRARVGTFRCTSQDVGERP